MKLSSILFIAVFLTFGLGTANAHGHEEKAEGHGHHVNSHHGHNGHHGVHGHGGDMKFSMEKSIGMMSHYVFRGETRSDKPSIHPMGTVSSGDLSFNVWGFVSSDRTKMMDDDGEPNALGDEINLTFDYTPSFDLGGVNMSVSVGYIQYLFPNMGSGHTEEAYLGFGFDVLLNPSLMFYWDFNEREGAYLNISIGHDFEMCEQSSISIYGNVGAGRIDDDSAFGFRDFNISVSMNRTIGAVTFSPVLNYTYANSDLGRAKDTGTVWGGVNFSVAH